MMDILQLLGEFFILVSFVLIVLLGITSVYAALFVKLDDEDINDDVFFHNGKKGR